MERIIQKTRSFSVLFVALSMLLLGASPARASAGLVGSDVGATSRAGSFRDDGDSLTITATGAGMESSEDSLHFAHRALHGDGEIVVHIGSVTSADRLALAGVMMREGLDPGARNVLVSVAPGGGIAFSSRSTPGGWTHRYAFPGRAPLWLKLSRVEDTFSAYTSQNGVDWARLIGVPVAMNGDIRVGLAAASQSGGAETTAVFDSLGVAEAPLLPGRGTVTMDYWTDLPGAALADLLAAPDYPASPTGSVKLDRIETPSGFGDEYGARIRGYIHPPVSGDYTFWISGDNESQLYLSSDDSPYSRSLIASVATRTAWREWSKLPEQRSAPISLESGVSYYFEVLQKEAGGSDHVSVGWSLPGGASAAPDRIVRGNDISPYLDPPTDAARGRVSMEFWSDIPGFSLASLGGDPRYPSAPSRTLTLPGLVSPSGLGDSYASRIRAYLHPPVTGRYTFWIAGDDQCALYLSTDSDPINKVPVAQVPGWTFPMQWTKYGEQRSAEIYLVAGRTYYVEALHKEALGGDSLAVAWRLPGSTSYAPLEIPNGDSISMFTPVGLAITSHRDGQAIFAGGVELRGVAADPEGDIDTLRISVNDSSLGRTVEGAPLSRDPGTGAWSFLLADRPYAPGSVVDVTVTLVTRGPEPRSFSERARLEVVPTPRLDWPMGERGHVSGVSDASGNAQWGAAGPGGIDIDSGSPASSDGGTCGYARVSGGARALDGGRLDLGLNDKVTVAAWVRWGVHPETGAHRAHIAGESAFSIAPANRFWLGHDANNTKFEFGVRVPGGQKLTTGGAPRAGRWTHVAGVYDGRSTHLYVDGDEVGASWCSQAPCAPSRLVPLDAAQRFTVGLGADATRAFHGDIDEVEVYAEALSRAQIQRIMRPERRCAATADTTPPVVAVTSPADGAAVADSGFVLSGTVSDDQEIAGVRVTVDDPVKGRVLDDNPVSVRYPAGTFALAVMPDQITAGETVTVTVTGEDADGNAATTVARLRVVAVTPEIHHLLSRITFGATPALLGEVQAMGAEAYLRAQLRPAVVEDAAFDAAVAAMPTTSQEQLRSAMLRRALGSKKQLQEVMTWFWENHFNTNFLKHRNAGYERAENDAFRANALGRFRDLLGVSAHSPAMLVYLNVVTSRAGAPNEDYARELMELHTLGVDGGYADADVANVARVFTGWRVSTTGGFAFDLSAHDRGAKVVLGQGIAPAGASEGEQVLDLLASHPSTARFLCKKLARVFVDDDPPAPLVGSCASEFLRTSGDIAAVVGYLIRSPAFSAPAAFRGKIKTPLEFMTSMARGFGATPSFPEIGALIERASMNLFGYPIPTGYSEVGADWLTGFQLVERINAANRFVRANRVPDGQTAFDLQPILDNRRATSTGVARYFAALVFEGAPLPVELAEARELLDAAGDFDVASPAAVQRIDALQTALLSGPGNLVQ